MALSDQMKAEIDKQNRIAALNVAIAARAVNDTPDDVLLAAKKYYEFLKS